VRRIGAAAPVPVDVRVIAATHRSLAAEVNRGTFRPDLFYRLAVIELTIPPLRERLSDVPLLVAHLLVELGRRPDELSPATVAELQRYRWPGNVRELRNFLERSIALDEAAAHPAELAPAVSGGGVDLTVPFRVAKERAVSAFERAYIEGLLQAAGGNVAAAARQGRMDRMYLYRLLQQHGIGQERSRRRRGRS
jgi:DNA-binding NtrC family response regulator